MRWRLLGPMRLHDEKAGPGAEPVDLGPGKQRCLLASLLMTPRQVVPAGTLVDRVWGETPPRSVTPLAPYATRLRRVLDQVPGAGAIRWTAGGYLIDCEPEEVDLHLARRQVFEARAAEEAGDHRQAARLMLTALDDWGPEALAGVPGLWAARVRYALARERLDIMARLGRAGLRLGRADEVAERIGPHSAEHPTVESLAAVLMEALVAAGRPAQALEAFARTRDAIAEELGSEPGADLTGLHTRILRGEAPGRSATAARFRPGTPAQLPADAIAFTGRRAELGELDRALGGGPRIAAVTGPPGVGKSALAVHWGHRARRRFPDGQLYLNLRGFDSGGVMSPEEAARNLLVALAPDRPAPAGLDARTGLLRSMLAGRRVLLVLDNAKDAGHVRPLLPGAGECVVLVTSRDRLTGLVASHGAWPVPLDSLDPGQAGELLAGRLGAGRLAAEPCTVATLVTATAGLPLALVTVAARAAMRAGQPLGELAAEIAGSRLDGLGSADGETDPRTVFSWSYRALSPAAARVFRLLGANPGPDLSAAAAHSLAGTADAAAALAELAEASLVCEHRPGRYAMHDLLRAYASDLLESEERGPALRRLLDHHLHTGHAAALALDSQREPLRLAAPEAGVRPEPIDGEAAALAWFAVEHAGLMAAIRTAADLDDYGWQLPWVVIDFLDRQGHWDDWITAERIAVAAAHRRGEVRAEALAQRVLARGYVQLGRYGEAEPHYAEADRLYQAAGDPVGRAHTLFSISWMREQQGRDDDCLRLTNQALELYRAAGHRVGEARALNALGWYLGRLGHHDLTLRHCRAALALQQELGDRYGEAAVWDSIGWAHHHLGDHDRAVAAYRTALDLYRAAGDLLNEAEIREHLGDAYAGVGDAPAAAGQWRQALALLEKLDHPAAAGLRIKLRS
ncbi:DNA-binding SARP family transcriptional activator/tetratricopeptide (TPR) repeat protein [Actinoplanes campanulatus]|uniref:DNA-binding SARP family transcriptional activator/tetratricopeptide (TPR) repeat protein n=1 Tax=Actinoplanes campanulatus TaxID=113559 RepID=A0A7W5AIN7_9ACTN|nr:AfsR/SARP family transcriptional regulator [Actinoplanes campanulatus]MBB3096770.1 DNA-binding SARP family transcriptional activator/tetratricopeptide (TPR) repeat protein [Actinoplanes campanulatus]GGN31136.1 SARP family transcriptional regulator [Actinoplanes campanulatus]